MPTYVYGCDTKEHPRCETTHGMKEDPEVRCEECDSLMHRIPQPLRDVIYGGVLLDWMNENYRRYRAGKPRFSPYRVKRPEGIPGREFHTR